MLSRRQHTPQRIACANVHVAPQAVLSGLNFLHRCIYYETDLFASFPTVCQSRFQHEMACLATHARPKRHQINQIFDSILPQRIAAFGDSNGSLSGDAPPPPHERVNGNGSLPPPSPPSPPPSPLSSPARTLNAAHCIRARCVAGLTDDDGLPMGPPVAQGWMLKVVTI
jgi:hypothetical protein